MAKHLVSILGNNLLVLSPGNDIFAQTPQKLKGMVLVKAKAFPVSSLCFQSARLLPLVHCARVCVCVCVCVRNTLSEIWDLEVLCDCTDAGQPVCTGACLGLNMTVGGGEGLGSAHPSALQSDWSLRYGKPLVTPSRAPQEYLPCIFISSLTSALPWQQPWSAQILSTLAWAQVGLACDYTRVVVMRALHKAVQLCVLGKPLVC